MGQYEKKNIQKFENWKYLQKQKFSCRVGWVCQVLLSLTSDVILKGCATSFRPQLRSVSGISFSAPSKQFGCLRLEHCSYNQNLVW